MKQINAIVDPSQAHVVRAQEFAIEQTAAAAEMLELVDDPDKLVVREMLPHEDLESGGDNGWNGTDEEWKQTGLAANSDQHVYAINSNGAARDKILVFYGLANVASDPVTTTVDFRDGTGAVFASFNVEPYTLAEVSDFVLYKRPIIYGSTEDGDIHHWARSANDDRVVHLAKVAEQAGETVTERKSQLVMPDVEFQPPDLPPQHRDIDVFAPVGPEPGR